MAHNRSNRSKSRQKSRQSWDKFTGAGFRKSLINQSLARSAAKGITTKKAKTFVQTKIDDDKANALYEGVQSMATVMNAPEEIADKLAMMDPQKLGNLYKMNSRIFEVYYSYTGIDFQPGFGNIASTDKWEDAEFLIQEYEKVFGEI